MDTDTQFTPHSIAARFYDGMTQAAFEARQQLLAKMQAEFARRDLEATAIRLFNKSVGFHKRLRQLHNGLPGAPIFHSVPRFVLEYFCCQSALNLYRLPSHTEQFKAELLSNQFYRLCAENEMEWLGIYDADIPDFKHDTGHAPGQWRVDIIKAYLSELWAKSKRDSDTLVAMRRFLDRQGLSKGRGVDVTPALQEDCALLLDNHAGWLERYLKFHAF